MRKLALILLVTAIVACLSFYVYSTSMPDLPADVGAVYASLPASLDYNTDVKPILSDKCFACHGPDRAKRKAGLRLDAAVYAYDDLPEDKGKTAIKPGNLRYSEFFHRIVSGDPKYIMPTPASHLTLNAIEKATLIKWIRDGAVYQPHWAFVKPIKSPIPLVTAQNGVINTPIDNFILAKLQQKQLKPSARADKEILLRRLTLDLTGLPPTIEEMDSFLKDNSSGAYEKQVDRLLHSPHYGEKMATDWLDAARFADSHGYTIDRIRDMSPYRDWVIRAFNSNMPYSTFLQWQLAGDLMPKPSRDMLIATAFNRNHPQNMEGGIIEQEFQTEYVIDRTNTFGTAMLGLSVGCAKCHDHKYDPVSQKNYYELFSFFNNVKEAGQISYDDAMPAPTLLLPTLQKEKIIAQINSTIRQQQREVESAAANADQAFYHWMDTQGYASLRFQQAPAANLQAHFNFDQGDLLSTNNRSLKGQMRREMGQVSDSPVFASDQAGKSLTLDGDSWLDLAPAGIFNKSEPFTIGIRVNIPAGLTDAVILHKCIAERLYNFRGYYLQLKNNQLELGMAHVAPANAISKVMLDKVPHGQWLQLTVSYDGSSAAAGLKLYVNGREARMGTVTDQLTKEIIFQSPASLIGGRQPGLQIGGWWRGSGLKGGKVDDIWVYDRALTTAEIKVLSGNTTWSKIISDEMALPAARRSLLKQYFLSVADQQLKSGAHKLTALRQQLADTIEHTDELMIMQEMARPRKTYLLKRGNYDMPGEQVFPNTPGSILPFAKELPKNRYGLAMWLTKPENPLTARVAVNRIWQCFFGTGLVKTAEDFGNQGEMPSHPELLDWLAVNFRETGWDIKRLNKMIVMSATYQQNSSSTQAAREKDPENRFLSHGPAYRMTAEMIRDNALTASGLLNEQVGGKSVKPYQPGGLWEINNTTYNPDSGRAVYRRSLYVIIKRSVPNPTLATFDAPARSYCIMRRQKTNTPLQALVTLNDPTFIEAARVMGAQMVQKANIAEAIILTYRKLTGRRPNPEEVALLASLREMELKKFRQHPAKQKGWLESGQYHISGKMDKALIAANTVVASTILNSDAALTKR